MRRRRILHAIHNTICQRKVEEIFRLAVEGLIPPRPGGAQNALNLCRAMACAAFPQKVRFSSKNN
jgi:hypothetical protein